MTPIVDNVWKSITNSKIHDVYHYAFISSICLNSIYVLKIRTIFELLLGQLTQDIRSFKNYGLKLAGDKTWTYFTIYTLCADDLAGKSSFEIFFKTKRSTTEIFKKWDIVK